MSGITEGFAALQGALFQSLVLPSLYALGLMDLAEPAFDATAFVLQDANLVHAGAAGHDGDGAHDAPGPLAHGNLDGLLQRDTRLQILSLQPLRRCRTEASTEQQYTDGEQPAPGRPGRFRFCASVRDHAGLPP